MKQEDKERDKQKEKEKDKEKDKDKDKDKEKEKDNPKVEKTALQKFTDQLYFIFCGNESIDPVINRSIISNTYMQLTEILHFTLLFTIFGQTNNSTYDITQTILSSTIILVCFVPRAMNKYYSYLFTMLVVIFITLASAALSTILIINQNTFQNYCNILSSYANKNPDFNFRARGLCSSITQLYFIELGFGFFIEALRIVYIVLIFKAYQASKQKFNEQEKRRRRKEKFDENMRNKNPFNIHRKI